MLTILLRDMIVNKLQRPVSSNYRQSILVRNFLCTSVRRRRQLSLPQLSPYYVNLLLRENEFTYTFTEQDCPVYGYESNQLGANKPCEDARAEASFMHKSAFICGIFDGHRGPACSQAISKRLMHYIAASVIDRQLLKQQMQQHCDSQSFLRSYNDKMDFVSDIKDLYEYSFIKFIQRISILDQSECSKEIQNAFLCLDSDLSKEAINYPNAWTMAVAMSGATACIAYVEGRDLHLASTGGCTAVLGSYNPEIDEWEAKELTTSHDSTNRREVTRVLSQHPRDERHTAIQSHRLLGGLQVLRALGNFRYKWSNETMEKYIIPVYGEVAKLPFYYTPPYLTAEPEMKRYKLTPNNKFLIMASDGFWNFLTPTKAVNVIGDHITSKHISDSDRTAVEDTSLEFLGDFPTNSFDRNAATHLLRYALGASEYGVEHSKVSFYLSVPQNVVRLFRDDITITVIYFNNDCISALTHNESRRV